jgi:hypothetical protein
MAAFEEFLTVTMVLTRPSTDYIPISWDKPVGEEGGISIR